MNTLTPEEVLAFLSRVDAGLEKVEKSQQAAWEERTHANHVFVFPSGWRVEVFNDGGSWDYIDNVIAWDGRTYDCPHGPCPSGDEHDPYKGLTPEHIEEAVGRWRGSPAHDVVRYSVDNDSDAVKLAGWGLTRPSYFEPEGPRMRCTCGDWNGPGAWHAGHVKARAGDGKQHAIVRP